jgi:hypothetical protein
VSGHRPPYRNAFFGASESQVTGGYLYHLSPLAPNPQAKNSVLQDRLVAICAELSGVPLPT